MDWLERESKKCHSLVIDLTKPGEDSASSEDSSVSSTHDSDDSDYNKGDDSKPRHKKTISHNKRKTPDKGTSPRNKNPSLTMLSRVCEVESNDKVEEISVNEDNKSHTIFPADLFNASLDPDIGPLINLGTQHDGRSARTWMKRV